MSAPSPDDRVASEPPSPPPWALAVAVTASIILIAIVMVRLQPPAPLGPDAAPSLFSAARARVHLDRLYGSDTPRPVGSAAHAQTREGILHALREIGYEPSLQSAFSCGDEGTCAHVVNVLARHEGRRQGRAVLLMAHYDTVPAAPGAADNGAGVSTLLEVARALKALGPQEGDVLFLFDDGEEAGLLGARVFTQHAWARDVVRVINVEAHGTRGASLLFESLGESGGEIAALSSMIERPVASSFFTTIYQAMGAGTSLSVFGSSKVSGLNFAFVAGLGQHHNGLNRAANVSDASLQHHGDNVLASTLALANASLEEDSWGNAVFFDILAWRLLWWPEAWTPWLSAVTGLGLVALLITLFRKRRLAARPFLWGFALVPVFLAAVGMSLAAFFALESSGVLPAAAVADPGPERLAFIAFAFAAPGAAGALLSRRAGGPGLWAATWSAYWLVAMYLSVVAPGLAYFALVPSLVAAISGWAWTRGGAFGKTALLASLPPCAIAIVLAVGPALLVHDAVGSLGLLVTSSLCVIGLLGLAPLAALTRRHWLLMGGACAVAMALFVAAALTPPFTEETPVLANLHLHHDADSGRTWKRVHVLAGVEPEPEREAVERKRIPWEAEEYAAVDMALSLEGPELVVQESTAGSGEGLPRRVSAHLRSRRSASELHLLLPPEARVRSIFMEGVEVKQPEGSGGWRRYVSKTIPPEGLSIEIIMEGTEPTQAILLDTSYSLPSSLRPPGFSVPSITFDDGHVLTVSRSVTF